MTGRRQITYQSKCFEQRRLASLVIKTSLCMLLDQSGWYIYNVWSVPSIQVQNWTSDRSCACVCVQQRRLSKRTKAMLTLPSYGFTMVLFVTSLSTYIQLRSLNYFYKYISMFFLEDAPTFCIQSAGWNFSLPSYTWVSCCCQDQTIFLFWGAVLLSVLQIIIQPTTSSPDSN